MSLHLVFTSASVPEWRLISLTAHLQPTNPLQADGLCSNDGVIIQTVTSDPASAETLGQSQLVVAAEGQSQDDQLEATSLLESSESVVTETQEPMTDGFSHKVQTFNLKRSEFTKFNFLLS